jgi:hypothetical protein
MTITIMSTITTEAALGQSSVFSLQVLIPDAPLRGAMKVESGAEPCGRPKGKHWRGPEGPHPILRLKTED